LGTYTLNLQHPFKQKCKTSANGTSKSEILKRTKTVTKINMQIRKLRTIYIYSIVTQCPTTKRHLVFPIKLLPSIYGAKSKHLFLLPEPIKTVDRFQKLSPTGMPEKMTLNV